MFSEYLIDPYIISILFREQDPEKVLEIYRDILDKAGKVFDLTARNFLVANNITEDEITKALSVDSAESLSENIVNLFQSEELSRSYKENIKSLFKAYYDLLLPQLNQEKKVELEKYLVDNKEMLLEQAELFSKGVSVLTDIMHDAGVDNYSALEKKTGFEQLVGNYLSSPTSQSDDKKVKFDKLVSDYLKSL